MDCKCKVKILFLNEFFLQYFSNSVVTWILYCCFVAIIFITLKTINFTLHRMYDTAQGFPTAGQKSNVEVIRK